MSQSAKTIDEKFLIKLFQLAKKKGSEQEEVDQYLIGRELGLHDRAVATIVRTLAQTNFIKRGGENKIYLTQNGISLIINLQGASKGNKGHRG